MVVEDENDNAPTFSKSWYEGRVRENCRLDCEVMLDQRIRATDPDKGAHSEFAVALQGDGKEFFTLTPSGKVMLKTPVDRETKDVYALMIVATDRGMLT